MNKNMLLCILFAWVGCTFAQEGDWIPQSPPLTSKQFNDIHIFDENTAIAVGESGTVMKTTDGGVTWEIKPTEILYGHLLSVYFVNASIGWAVGSSGSIIKTTDGGEIWETQDSGTSSTLYSVHFVNFSSPGRRRAGRLSLPGPGADNRGARKSQC